MHLETQVDSYVLYKSDAEKDAATQMFVPVAEKRKLQIVWLNVIVLAGLHIGAAYGGYLAFTKAKWASVVFGKCMLIYRLIRQF